MSCEDISRNNPPKEIEVERLSLAEFNAVLVENGFEPFTEKEIYGTNRKYYCGAASFFGDWTSQIYRTRCNYWPTCTVSINDYSKARNYILDNGGTSTNPVAVSGIPWGDYPTCTSENFGTISYFDGSGTGEHTVDQEDLDIVRDFILGVCN